MIFLGGTCNESTWRRSLKNSLDHRDIKYFDPVVDDWNEEAQAKEDEIKACPTTINLFVITCQMTGVFSIAEAVDSSNKKPDLTVFCFQESGFKYGQLKSLYAVRKLIRQNGATVCSWNELVDVLRDKTKP